MSFSIDLSSFTTLINREACIALLPGEHGEIGILENHIDMVAKLKSGIARIDEEKFYISHGFAHFKNNKLVISANFIEVDKDLTKDYLENKIQSTTDQEIKSFYSMIMHDKVV